ncbi:class I SAM-dependent methyltransferase [Plantibacter sp. Mn2098]|uniref:class I SAM-dependent methyltransferase n=1 Tax=Plantibacter sp. Mn2098 TaxID=3395266 RepID=UPI003BBEE568
MPHDQTHDPEPTFDRDYWEQRYGAPGLTWSGDPNAVLVTEATPLTPGRALDIGSGEGGDALWLAKRKWLVTGVDISSNALAKARARCEAVDDVAAARIRWEQHDLTEWQPAARSYDLVSSHFMHLAEPARTTLFRSLAAAVAPGGTLLIVGHDVSESDDESHRGHLEALMFGIEDVLGAIDGEGLRVEVAESRIRTARVTPGADAEHHHDAAAPMRDIIVRATRA